MRNRIAFHSRISMRIILMLLILFAITAVIVGLITENKIRSLYEDNFTERVLLSNALIASNIDSEDVDYFVELIKNQDDEFKQRQIQFYYDRKELFNRRVRLYLVILFMGISRRFRHNLRYIRRRRRPAIL